MLWLGLMTRDTGIPASERLKIRDEVTAFGLDAAVSLRLLTFDNERAKGQARLIAMEVGRLLGGPGIPEEQDDSVLNADVIHRDRWTDDNTQVW